MKYLSFHRIEAIIYQDLYDYIKALIRNVFSSNQMI